MNTVVKSITNEYLYYEASMELSEQSEDQQPENQERPYYQRLMNQDDIRVLKHTYFLEKSLNH